MLIKIFISAPAPGPKYFWLRLRNTEKNLGVKPVGQYGLLNCRQIAPDLTRTAKTALFVAVCEEKKIPSIGSQHSGFAAMRQLHSVLCELALTGLIIAECDIRQYSNSKTIIMFLSIFRRII